MSVCSILAEVTFTQAKGKMWFLSYHWELPILAGPDEIHPGTLAEPAEITWEAFAVISEDTWRVGDIFEDLKRVVVSEA